MPRESTAHWHLPTGLPLSLSRVPTHIRTSRGDLGTIKSSSWNIFWELQAMTAPTLILSPETEQSELGHLSLGYFG